MKQLFRNAALVLLWLALCVLFLSGCHATAPAAAVGELGALTGTVEKTFLESLYLFIGTDYGEFCAFLACAMATHLIFVIHRYVLPWLTDKAPCLTSCLKRLVHRLRLSAKRNKSANNTLQNDLLPSFDDTKEDTDAPSEEDAPNEEATHNDTMMS